MLGMRHLALNVSDPQRSKDFYTRVLGMQVEWEPDADNVYLTSEGQDNLALHKLPSQAGAPAAPQALDHLGFVLARIDDVDQWYKRVKSYGIAIVNELKTHRDGARSFYFRDPDGILIQIIYHPPIAQASARPPKP